MLLSNSNFAIKWLQRAVGPHAQNTLWPCCNH